MSGRMYITIGVTLAALAFGGWRMLLPASESNDVTKSVSTMLSTTLNAQFTGAEASLDAQRNATGSYVGANVQPPITLVRVSDTSYCIQLEQGAVLQHVNGPGGTAVAGAC
jgi:hypothetical protein